MRTTVTSADRVVSVVENPARSSPLRPADLPNTPNVAAAFRACNSVCPSDVAADSGKVEFDIKSLTINSPGAGPAINLGDTRATLELEKGVLTIVELKSKGGDLSVEGTGTVRLAQDLMSSPLAMRLSIVPAAHARQKLQFLLGMLPHPPGISPYVLKGTIGAPGVQ